MGIFDRELLFTFYFSLFHFIVLSLRSHKTVLMKTLWNKFDKKLISELPRATFGGKIIVIDTVEAAQTAVSYLLKQPLLGFDTETKPTFRPGPMRPVALLQISAADTCYLFRLSKMGLPDCLVDLLKDKEHKKVALSWGDDSGQLHHLRNDFEMGSFIELQTYVRSFGIEDASLQKLYANVFRKKISKSQQLSNWEAEELSAAQKLYAATDAWACVRLYEELERLKVNKKWKLRKHEDAVSA